MTRLVYRPLSQPHDTDVPTICAEMDKPAASRFLSYDKEHFWNYVTMTPNVFYYKVYDGKHLVGALHAELAENVLYMGILVFEAYRRQGFGKRILADVLNDKLPIAYKTVCVSIDRENEPSIRLFEKMGFVLQSTEDELLEYSFSK